jgi:hypothetical protein
MTALAHNENPRTANEDECPSWCCGGCDENTELHANEFEGTGSYAADGGAWHAIARTVQDRCGGPALIEISVLDQDGNETAVRLTPDQASELSAAIDASIGCALRIA